MKKLDHFNGEYIRALPSPSSSSASSRGSTTTRRGRPSASTPPPSRPWRRWCRSGSSLAEVPGYVDFLFLDEPAIDDDLWKKVMVKAPELAATMLDAAVAALRRRASGTPARSRTPCSASASSTSVAKSKAQAPVRVAVTGRTVGPPLCESLVLLGRDETLLDASPRAAASRL